MHSACEHASIRSVSPAQACLGLLLLGPATLIAAAQPARDENNLVYEIFVRSFADSNGDGIGDLNGITAKLDSY